MSAEVPHYINDYKILAQVASTASSDVYLGHRKDGGKRVAVKIAKPGGELFVAREVAALQLLEDFKDPRIISYVDSFNAPISSKGVREEREAPVLITEYAKGGALHNHIPSNGMPVGLAVEIITQTASGLEVVHNEYEFVHGDIKPANIVVDENKKTPKIIDFALAHPTKPNENFNYALDPTKAWGTPQFMSAEKFEGEMIKGADVYALGLVAFRMLTGKQPVQKPTVEKNGDFSPESLSACIHDHREDKLPKYEESLGERMNPIYGELAVPLMDTLRFRDYSRPSAGEFGANLELAYIRGKEIYQKQRTIFT